MEPIYTAIASCFCTSFFRKQCTVRVLNAFLSCPPWCWMVCPPSRGLVSPYPVVSPCLPFVSHCLPTCVPVLDGVSAFPRSCLPLSPLVSHCLPLSPHMSACVGWCVRLPDVLSPLVSHFLPTCVPVLDDVSAFPRSCLPLSPLVSPCPPLSPIVSLHVCLCWMPPSQGLVAPCLPLSPCDLFLPFTCLHNASCMLTCNTEFTPFMRTPHGSRLA